MNRRVIRRRDREGTADRTRLRTRLAAGTIALGVIAAGLLQPPQETEARWADGDSGRATFTANLARPVATAQCLTESAILGLGPRVTMYWRVPAEATGMTVANVQYGRLVNGAMRPATSAELAMVTTTGTPNGYTTGVQGGLLSGLLGGSVTVGIRFVNAEGWTSSWLTADATIALLGLATSCTNSSRAS
ncbi:hypothetical protein PQI23_00345 [Leucobacter sp. USCH14]|uniref:hypothetical protein n=1 Tax=Leucobacter sp. USCH14 TaxID=3024838 RepID=UPI0030A0AF18